MKTKFTLLFQLIFLTLYGQNEIKLKDPVKAISTEKVNSEIKKGTEISLIGLGYVKIEGVNVLKIFGKKNDGNVIGFDPKKIDFFEFQDINNINKVWSKHLLLDETYLNLLTKGSQYELRSDLNNESIEYINTLSNNNRFFDDHYFEDYLYTLVNKIYSGNSHFNRRESIFVKILKDPQPNAFSLPNGCVLISTGLLSTIQSEDELVGVLAHEIAHFALDHQILNYNKEIDRKKRAEFWSNFATVVAAGADAYLTINNKNHIPGVLTASTAITASAFSEDIINRLGVKYNKEQESEADSASTEILKVLNYNKLGLSAALTRIKEYSIINGNYLALSGSNTHPNITDRIASLGIIENIEIFNQANFLRKASLINSYNAWMELWYFYHHYTAIDLADRNIKNGMGTESDYIVKSVAIRRISDTRESNQIVFDLLKKAKTINVTPYILLHIEEGIILMRLNDKMEAKKSFQAYLNLLNELKDKDESKDDNFYNKGIQD